MWCHFKILLVISSYFNRQNSSVWGPYSPTPDLLYYLRSDPNNCKNNANKSFKKLTWNFSRETMILLSNNFQNSKMYFFYYISLHLENLLVCAVVQIFYEIIRPFYILEHLSDSEVFPFWDTTQDLPFGTPARYYTLGHHWEDYLTFHISSLVKTVERATQSHS